MKKFLCVLFFIILFPNVFSQSNHNYIIVNDSTEYIWKPKLDQLLVDPPSYFKASDLKLLSYKLLSNEEMKVEEFLSMPIDNAQLFPEIQYYSKEELEEMKKENYEFESYLKMIPFSAMSTKDQYFKIGSKFYSISGLFYSRKPSAILKLQWKFKEQEFFTYCVVSGSQFVYDYILSNVFVLSAGSK